MAQCVSGSDALLRILVEQTRHHVLGIFTEAIPHVRIHLQIRLNRRANDLVVVFAVEGQFAAQQEEQDDTDGPEIGLLAVALHRQHFGRDIRQRSCEQIATDRSEQIAGDESTDRRNNCTWLNRTRITATTIRT